MKSTTFTEGLGENTILLPHDCDHGSVVEHIESEDYSKLWGAEWTEKARQSGDPTTGPLTVIRGDDTALVRYVVEEMVSLNATRVALIEYGLVFDLPRALEKRLTRIDCSNIGPAVKVTYAILSPITQEFGLTPEDVDRRMPSTKRLSDEAAKSLETLILYLSEFFLGLRQKCQIDIPLPTIRTALTQLREECRSSEARAHLAVLLGVFASYRPVTVDSLVLRACTRKENIELFAEFVDDEYYRELARYSHGLGWPLRFERSLKSLKRAVRRCLSVSPFRKLVDLSSRGLSTATQLPLPDSDFAASLFQEGYLPPIVSLRAPILRAVADWQRHDSRRSAPWIAEKYASED
jgi:hypothetical protein